MAGRRTAPQIVLRDDERSELEALVRPTEDWGGHGDAGTHRSGMRKDFRVR